jgi:hypothetical protein
VDDVDRSGERQHRRGVALWTTAGAVASGRQTATVSIDVPVLQVFDLADRLRAAAAPGHDAAARLEPADPTGAIAAALEDAFGAFGTLGRALAVETDDLGDTVEAVARSWMALDAGLLARRGQVLAR